LRRCPDSKLRLSFMIPMLPYAPLADNTISKA
jgi:hypothetical protein